MESERRGGDSSDVKNRGEGRKGVTERGRGGRGLLVVNTFIRMSSPSLPQHNGSTDYKLEPSVGLLE